MSPWAFSWPTVHSPGSSRSTRKRIIPRAAMKNLISIERKKLDPNRLYGVVVAQSSALTLLHYEYDFQFDGFVVIRTRDISLRTSTEVNEYSERLMRREGLWKEVPRWVKKLSVTGWRELLSDLVGKIIIAEDELREDLCIGRLLEAGAKYAAVHYFNGCGQLKEVEKVFYSRITLLRFGDRYSTIHGKYVSSDK